MNAVTGQVAVTITRGGFIDKQKFLTGDWSIEQDGESRYVVLAENFKAKSGPDLKIFLPPTPPATATGKSALNGSLLISQLDRVKGSQWYPILSDIGLCQFKSLIVHCEKYAFLWVGGTL